MAVGLGFVEGRDEEEMKKKKRFGSGSDVSIWCW